ncbi:Smr/MutS family protein [Methylomonas koyamae]|uniref:Smr/MutS family protein n=1 Tax=Methylomonas koyamae TaxID=702114 RepID=UPI000A5A76FA|nr:Smr/MutS family protein [Methylomonas koyamae]
MNPKLSAIELLATICDELGIAHDGMTAKSLIDAINRYLLSAYAAGRRTVLLIDEARI